MELLRGSSADDPLADVVKAGLTSEDWIRAAVILVGSLILARLLSRLVKRVLGRIETDESIERVVSRLVQNVVIVLGVVYTLASLGVRITPLLGALGIGGLALAFAAQSILENVFASIILQTRRPFKRGDQITTNDHSGTVIEVNFRTVLLRTYDGEQALIPCSQVLGNPIVNHTANGIRRTTVDIGVAYDTNLQNAQRVMLDAASGVDGVAPDPAPQALVEEFGDSAISIALRYWHRPDIASKWQVRSDLAVAVKASLDEAGIEIPFPQRVVTIGSGG